jgi:hypothetical protein
MTTLAIATHFSNGAFEKVYSFLANDIVWEIVGENTFTGKEAVMNNCTQVAAYFASVTTVFATQNIVANNNLVAINGTAEFLKQGKQVAYVQACDMYQFNKEGMIKKITSYCIQKK